MPDPAGPAFPAPFRCGPFPIRPEWIDENGHLNLAHYVTIFDYATDAFWLPLGLGAAFRASGFGTFAAETHTLYRAEMLEGQSALVEASIVAVDAKRLHVAYTMTRAHDAAISAHQELMYLCVDLGTRRVAAWPDPVRSRLQDAVQRERPDWLGRAVAMPNPPAA